jgi:hypothetical protein
MTLPFCKKCNFCKKENYLCVETIKKTMSCPCCQSVETYQIKDINLSDTVFFCQDCKILFKTNTSNIHHSFVDGNIYVCDIVSEYELNGQKVYSMPQFHSMESCQNLLTNKKIVLKWTKIYESDECCVCFNDNYLLTKCGHSLCQQCKNKLVLNSCPICRKEIFIEPFTNNNNNNNTPTTVDDENEDEEDDTNMERFQNLLALHFQEDDDDDDDDDDVESHGDPIVP